MVTEWGQGARDAQPARVIRNGEPKVSELEPFLGLLILVWRTDGVI